MKHPTGWHYSHQTKVLLCRNLKPKLDISVVPGSVQVPENRTHGQKSFRTGPGTARISESVIEPEPEPLKALGQFQNLNCFGMLIPTFKKRILFGCVAGHK